MKNLFALSFFLLFTSSSISTMGQTPLVEKTFNHAYQTESVDFERYDENHWLIGHTAYTTPFLYYGTGRFCPEVMMVNNEAEIIWKTTLVGGREELKDILLLENRDIVILIKSEGGDDIVDYDYRLHVLNTEGTIEKSISLKNILSEYYPDYYPTSYGIENTLLKMLPLDSNKIWVFYDDGNPQSFVGKINGIIEVNLETAESQLIKEWNFQDVNIYDVAIQPNDKIWLATNEGVWELNKEGEIEQKHDSTAPILKIKENNLITKTHFLQFDTELNLLQTTDFSSRFDSLVNFHISDDFLWLIGQSANSNTHQFDKISLDNITSEPVFSKEIVGTQTFPIGLQPFEDKVLVMGNETVQLTPRTFFKTYDAAIGDSQDYSVDIGIVEMDLANFQKAEHPIFHGYFFEAYLTLKNHGDDTIHQFNVNYQDTWLGTGQRHIYYPNPFTSETLTLPPNETLKIGIVNGLTIYGSFGQEKEICLWVTGPNDRIDRDHSNNSSCETVVLSDIASPIADSNDISIFPNPFRQKLEIHTQNQFLDDAQVTIFNTLGQVVYRSELKSKQTVLELKELQSGVYIVEVKNRNSGERWTERVVKY